MPDKFIKTIHDRVNFAIKKGLTGFVPPTKIDNEVHAESLNLWNKYVEEYERTRKIGMFLGVFEKIEELTGLSGSAAEVTKDVVACHSYPIAAATTGNVNVPILAIAEYAHRFKHPIKGPDADHPICKFVNNKIYVAPQISQLNVTYLAKPTAPKYAYTQTAGNKYEYDDTNSIDFEWDERVHDQIMVRVLANLGINMREAQLIQYSELEKRQEGK